MTERIGVAGAGTMGAGIAQLAALAGYETLLHDPEPEALERGIERLRADLARGVDRGRWTAADAEAATALVSAAPKLEDLAGCDLVVEAAPESLALKRELFRRLEEVCAPDAVLATNTSSLSVTAIAAEADSPQRICGMHYFNPPPAMRLVEVVAGDATADAALELTAEVARRYAPRTESAFWPTGPRVRSASRRCGYWESGSRTPTRSTASCGSEAATGWARSSSWT